MFKLSIAHKKSHKSDGRGDEMGTTAPEKTVPRRSVDEYSEVMRNEKPSDNHWAAYLPKPRKISIDILQEQEQIILVLRQHPITQVKWVLAVVAMTILPLLFSFSGIFNFLPGHYQFGIGLGWYLLAFGLAVQSFLKWFYRVYIVTDERIIDVDFISMIYKDVTTTKIDKIEDITSLSTGFLSSLADFGTVIIQTAAAVQELQFENVPHPSKVTSLLNDLILEEELEKYEGRVN